mmetsp:Transcript_44374/g.77982  ORF Transcript_44374/g.77982 Transcript_44374/m.77982 type:complete len:608 (+) Transcript_44374:84-1907(+)
MGVDAFPEDADWAPPPDVIRLLARQTAQVNHPLETEFASQSASRESIIGNIDEQPEIESSSGFAGSRGLAKPAKESPAASHKSFISTISRTWKGENRINNSPSQDTDFSYTQISDGESTGFDLTAGSPVSAATMRAHNHRYSIRRMDSDVQAPFWTRSHDTPWDNSLRVPQDLYAEATKEVCSCLTPFEEDAYFCRRCGTRRPDEAPPPIPTDVPKAISVINQSQDIVDRQYTWGGLYAQRLYKMQIKRFEDEQEWQRKEYFSPRTNPNSMRLALSKETVPLMERVQDIINDREQKLEEKRRESVELELQEVQEGPTIHPRSTGLHRNLRLLYRWDMKKDKDLKSRLDKQLEAESMQCPFKPEISAASNRITKDYIDIQVHKRLVKDAARRHMWADPDYQNTFASSPLSEMVGGSPGNRSKSLGSPSTPSTAAPSSARGSAGSSRAGGRSLSPYSRGCKTDSWRGKKAFPNSHPVFAKPGEAGDEAMKRAMMPRASQACIRFQSEDSMADAERRKLQGFKDKLRKSQAASAARSTSYSPSRSAPAPNTPDKRSRSVGRSASVDTPRSSNKLDRSRRSSDMAIGNGGNVVKYNANFHSCLAIAHASYD